MTSSRKLGLLVVACSLAIACVGVFPEEPNEDAQADLVERLRRLRADKLRNQKPESWAVGEHYKVVPETVCSTRTVNVKDRTASHDVRVVLGFRVRPGSFIALKGGFTVESALTAAGENLAPEWDRTAVWEWSQSDAGWERDPLYLSDGSTAAWNFLLKRPVTHLSELASLKGSLQVKIAEKVRFIELPAPGIWTGIDAPELKETGFTLGKPDGKTLKMELLKGSSKNFRLRSLWFVNGRDKRVPYTIAKVEVIGERLSYTLQFNRDVQMDDKAVVGIYDDIVDEQVPFDFSGIRLEPEVDAVATDPATLGPTVTELPTGDRIKGVVVPLHVTSTRTYYFPKKGEVGQPARTEQQLDVGLRIDGFISISGYHIEEVVTDVREKLPPFESQRKEVAVRPWEQPMSDGLSSDYTITLGKPGKPCNTIVAAKGYVIGKSAVATHKVTVNSPFNWVGKSIDLPELKDLNLRVTSIAGDLIKLAQPNTKDVSIKIRSIEFVDAAGANIGWNCEDYELDEQEKYITFKLKLDSAFPREGKMIFQIADDLRETKVPFELHDVKFNAPAPVITAPKVAPVKPPRPPTSDF